MEKEIIKLKGTGDGIKMYLDKDAPFSEILTAVSEKLKAWRSFFGSGHCHMYFVGRKLDKSDMLRLEAVVTALLPESTIIYGEKNIADTVQLPKQFLEELNKREGKSESGENAAVSETTEENPENKAENADTAETENSEGDEISAEEKYEFEKIKEVITTNYKSNRARLYEGVVKSGRVVESDGHLILVGSVEEGGTVIANGNVIVLGSLLGSAQAGCMGNASSYIIAMDMRPTDLR
ncbi:MAG: hypothetical protein LUD03_05345, partial [Firmicutes bacterium]|nr:hypothetical protein [Bacillota bacterium]